jgi:hypothetical protein
MSKKAGAGQGSRPRHDRVKAKDVTSKDLLSTWEEKFEEMDQARTEYSVVEMTFAGLPCKVKRMGLLDHLNANTIPTHIAAVLMAELSGVSSTEDEAKELSPQEAENAQKEFNEYTRAVICATLVEPRVVQSLTPAPGEISYGRLFVKNPTFISEVLAWVRNGCPGVPVKTKEGETSVGALENFREGQVVPASRPTSGSTQWQTEPSRRIV